MTWNAGLWRGLWLLILLYFSMAAVGQDFCTGLGCGYVSQGPLSQPQQKPHVVRGQVVDSVTSEPIYRALVQIGPQFAALTDHEGRFELQDVTVPDMALMARKPGYFPDPGSQFFDPHAVQPAGEHSVIVKLAPEAILSGTVTSADGELLQNVQVQLKMVSVFEGSRRWTQRLQATTNSQGQYRFAELESGRYAVVTGISREGFLDEEAAMGYQPVRYPGAGASPPAIQLVAGQHSEANLISTIERLYSVAGTVSGSGESPGVSFNVETTDGEDVTPPTHFDPGTGQFRMALPSGTFELTATTYLPTGARQARKALTIRGAPVRGVAIALHSAATIPVQVDAEAASQPAPEGAVLGPPSVSLGLILTDQRSLPQEVAATPLVGTDSAGNGLGARKFENVLPGHYRLQAAAGAPWYVSSATCGGLDLTHEELVIGGSAAGCAIRVLLRSDSGSVHISLKREDPDQGRSPILVYLFPLGDLTRSSQTVWNTQRWDAEGVAPGRYLALALDQAKDLPYRDPEALRQLVALGKEIAVTANGKSDLELIVVKAGALE